MTTIHVWEPENTAITMTLEALEYLKKNINKQGHGIGIRLGVKKTGCSGLAYTVDIIDAAEKDDYVYNVGDSLIVAVAADYLPYVQGTEIDFVQEGLNKRFKFKNPNEIASCGCGESFTVE